MSAKSRQSLLRAKLAQQLLSQAKGFTLIELLVVIVIVGVLSAVAIPQFLNQVRRSRTAEAQAALTAVGRASEVYRLDTSEYPAGYDDIKPTAANKGKYLNDPWSAANYKIPTVPFRNPLTGMQWQTESNGGAYVNASGQNIKCTIGLGDQETVVATLDTFVGKSCNVFQ